MTPRSRRQLRILLVATIVINAIAIRWLAIEFYSDGPSTLYFGLGVAHVSLFATWGVISAWRAWWAALLPFAAAPVIALGGAVATTRHERDNFWEAFVVISAIFALQAALAMATAWGLSQFRPDWFSRAREGGARWRFTTSHLLLLMTTTAGLVALTRAASELHHGWPTLVAFLTNNCLVLVATIAMQRMAGNRVLRFAATLAGAALFASVWEFMPLRLRMSWYSINLIQAIFLWVWLPWGFMIDGRDMHGADNTIRVRAG